MVLPSHLCHWLKNHLSHVFTRLKIHHPNFIKTHFVRTKPRNACLQVLGETSAVSKAYHIELLKESTGKRNCIYITLDYGIHKLIKLVRCHYLIFNMALCTYTGFPSIINVKSLVSLRKKRKGIVWQRSYTLSIPKFITFQRQFKITAHEIRIVASLRHRNCLVAREWRLTFRVERSHD